MDRLSGRVALVTGGSRGIGRQIAIEFARAGADVAVAYQSRRDETEDVAQLVRAAGRRSLCLGDDLSDPEEAGALVAEAAERLGPIDVLVNNAGINPSKPITQLTPEDWRQTINVNLSSAF